jgi:GTPase
MTSTTEHNILIQQRERAFLVGLGLRGGHPLLSIEDSLEELALLADTAGMDIVGQTQQNVAHIDPATFIGSGKVDEIKEMLLASEAQVVIFDDELSPRHQRGLENRFGEEVKVLDRSALILDIFAQHARTREGSLQVELAQYEYRLPRLTRAWSHLARLGGGIGTRGPGETQLEVDRRDIRRRISKLKEELESVRAHRSRHRDQRDRTGIPLIALVGYTNAGKSTLLKTLTGADVYIANQLFATLDPTTRRVDLPSGRQALISDTVGFIQKLPTTLIAAFRATLEEINDADLILEVADINHPNVVEHLETVEDTLAEIDVPSVPRILVWNKVDQWGNQPTPQVTDSQLYTAQVTVSATKKIGLDPLLEAVEKALSQSLYEITLHLPFERGDLASLLHEMGSVQEQTHTEDGIVLKVRLTHDLYERFQEYRV